MRAGTLQLWPLCPKCSHIVPNKCCQALWKYSNSTEACREMAADCFHLCFKLCLKAPFHPPGFRLFSSSVPGDCGKPEPCRAAGRRWPVSSRWGAGSCFAPQLLLHPTFHRLLGLPQGNGKRKSLRTVYLWFLYLTRIEFWVFLSAGELEMFVGDFFSPRSACKEHVGLQTG